MEIFKYNIKFLSWGEVYLGLKKQWINPNEVISFCESNRVKTCDDTRMVELILALEDSLFTFYEKVKKFIIEDRDSPIIKNEDEQERDFNYIPSIYWEIWKLEFLLRIDALEISTKEKLEEIAHLFDTFDYPEEWKPFLYYQSPPGGKWLNDNELYNKFNTYLNNKKNSLSMAESSNTK
jgi:hypothetical protein